MPKSRDGVCYPVLQDEYIQWLLEKLHANPDITLESLHHELNEAFSFHALYLSIVFQKLLEVKQEIYSS